MKKLNLFPLIISVAMCSLIAFGWYSWCHSEDMKLLISVAGGCCAAMSLGTAFGVSFERSRTAVNIKVLSGITALVIIVINSIFCCVPKVIMTTYIITEGLLLLLWLLICYGILKAEE